MHYMQSHLHYPDPIYRKYGFEGRLMVSFVVEKDGSLQHFSVIRNDINTKETAASLHVTEEEYETFINKRKAAFENVVLSPCDRGGIRNLHQQEKGCLRECGDQHPPIYAQVATCHP